MPSSPARSGAQALRRGRLSCPHGIYHVTTVTHARQAHFLNHHAARAACRSLLDLSRQADFKLLARVLMPDHLHCLLQLGDTEDLSRSVRRVKSILARSVNAALAREGAVWAHGFHDHALRANLVSTIGDYPYWDAMWL